jgi:predicted nuclease of predicted toxin-antitoxin system
MKILVDENIPRMTVAWLRALGHDVKDVRGTGQEGMPDPYLWRVARSEARLLITTDKGFTEYRAVAHEGMLVVRLRQTNRHKIHNAVMQAMEHFREAEWPNLLVVVRDATMSTSHGAGSAAQEQ